MCVLCVGFICSRENKWDFVSGWPKRKRRNFKIRITGIVRVISVDKLWNNYYDLELKCLSEHGCKKGSENIRLAAEIGREGPGGGFSTLG